jgi:hypothetical protein
MVIEEESQGTWLKSAYKEFENARSIINPDNANLITVPNVMTIGFVNDVMYLFLSGDDEDSSKGNRIPLMYADGTWATVVAVDSNNWKDKVDEVHEGQTGFFMEMELNENDVLGALNHLLEEYPDEMHQNVFWNTVRERIVAYRITEIEELNENIDKEKERIQRLKESLKELS